MMKKYFAIVPVLAVAFAFTVAPAFAGQRYDRHHRSEDKIEVSNWNDANVVNKVEAKSNTGDNEANKNSGIGKINTGDADSLAQASTTANNNETYINGRGYDRIEVENGNRADVRNYVEAKSETGDNEANYNGSSNKYEKHSRHHKPSVRTNEGKGVINTGNAISTASAVNLLNSNVTRIR